MLVVKSFNLLIFNIVEHVELVEGGHHPKILEKSFFAPKKTDASHDASANTT